MKGQAEILHAGYFHAFVVLCWLFKIIFFQKVLSGTLSVSNRLDQDQDRYTICKCYQKLPLARKEFL